MAGTRVKYPIRMIPSSVAIFFIIDQLSLLKPGEITCTERLGGCLQVNRHEHSLKDCLLHSASLPNRQKKGTFRLKFMGLVLDIYLQVK